MKSLADKVQAIADKVNGQVYKGYSGRWMFGKKCWGVVCEHSQKDELVRLSNKFGTTHSDQMGLDVIVYWPNLKEKEVETVQDKAQAINKKLFCTCGATLSDCREMFDQGGRCCPNCTHNLTKSKKEDTTMSKKISKKAERIAKAQAQKSAKEVEEKATEKASEAATITPPAPISLSAEEKIVAENIAKGDEATMALVGDLKKCPKCAADNPKERVTCLSCGEKFYPKKIAQLKTKKAAAAAKVKAEKKDKAPRYSRKDSVADAIDSLKTFTEDELISKADALIVEKGGSSNVKESKFVVTFLLPTLVRFGVVTVKASEGKDVGVTYLYNPKS